MSLQQEMKCYSPDCKFTSLNLTGVFFIFRDNLSQWEKIARGEVEDIVPSRPCESGPVKVDNWLPKGLLAHQRNTSRILPQTCNFLGGRTHILCWIRRRWISWRRIDFQKTHSYLIGWRRCQHWRFHRSQRLTDSRWGGTSTHHPTSTQLGIWFSRMDLCRFWLLYFGCFMLFYDFFFYLSWFFYGLVFAEALLWTFHRLGYVKSCCRFRLFWNGTVCLLW